MFTKPYEERLKLWSQFRQELETSHDPFNDVIRFYQEAPSSRLQVNPWDPVTWPNPWELLNENLYCDFSRVLGMCYSLQLTDRFKTSDFEIHICTFDNLGYVYLLFVDNMVLGYEENQVVNKKEIREQLNSQEVYSMPTLL